MAVDVAFATPTALLAEALRLQDHGDNSGAVGRAREALVAAEAAGDDAGVASARQVVGVLAALGQTLAGVVEASARKDWALLVGLQRQRYAIAVGMGLWNEATEATRGVLEACEHTADREGQADAVHQHAQLLLQAGNLDGAEVLIQRGLWVSDRAGEELGRSALLLLLAQVDRSRGLHERALRGSEQALELARSANKRQAVVEARHQLGVFLAGAGELERARRELEEALDGRELLRDLEGRAATLHELAEVELALECPADAANRLEYAARTLSELGLADAAAGMLHRAADAWQQAGQIERAFQAGQRLADQCQRAGDQASFAAALFTNGSRAVALGRLVDARDLFQTAAGVQGATGLDEERAISLSMLGQVQHALGDEAAALATLEEAEEALRRMGSEALEELLPILGELRGGGARP